MAVNKVFLIGNVGKDPEIKKLGDNGLVASFTLATTEKYTKTDGTKAEQTEWHNIVCFSRQAEIVRDYVEKGSSLFIEGKITTRSWESQDGQRHYVTEIRCTNLQLLSPKRDAQQPSGIKPIAKPEPRPEAYGAPAYDNGIDDLPF